MPHASTMVCLLVSCLCASLQACSSRQATNTKGQSPTIVVNAMAAEPQAMSLLGVPLYPPILPADIQQKRELELLNAQAEFDRDPHNEDAAIWLGRRLAYLGEYRQAIDVYTNALALHPGSTRLLRHRGHRYITLRLFNLALDDLELAANLMRSEPDDWEPDGQPNARNSPTGTNQSNILYHLGLAHYLTADFADAAGAWQRCAENSRTDDMRVAANYWLYLSLRRQNRHDEAAALLASVPGNLDIIENHTYYRLLLQFKGEIDVESATQAGAESATLGDVSIDEATSGYGIGMWQALRGEHDEALKRWRTVIDSTNWAAFGHIASEAELARAESPLE